MNLKPSTNLVSFVKESSHSLSRHFDGSRLIHFQLMLQGNSLLKQIVNGIEIISIIRRTEQKRPKDKSKEISFSRKHDASIDGWKVERRRRIEVNISIY